MLRSVVRANESQWNRSGLPSFPSVESVQNCVYWMIDCLVYRLNNVLVALRCMNNVVVRELLSGKMTKIAIQRHPHDTPLSDNVFLAISAQKLFLNPTVLSIMDTYFEYDHSTTGSDF